VKIAPACIDRIEIAEHASRNSPRPHRLKHLDAKSPVRPMQTMEEVPYADHIEFLAASKWIDERILPIAYADQEMTWKSHPVKVHSKTGTNCD
jgi:hypothetical protein